MPPNVLAAFRRDMLRKLQKNRITDKISFILTNLLLEESECFQLMSCFFRKNPITSRRRCGLRSFGFGTLYQN